MIADDASRWENLDVAGRSVAVRVEPQGRRQHRLWPSVGEYPIYDEFLYYVMLQDEPRNVLFRTAVQALAPDRVVLELGACPTSCGPRSPQEPAPTG